jgi:hypothetical protein
MNMTYAWTVYIPLFALVTAGAFHGRYYLNAGR